MLPQRRSSDGQEIDGGYGAMDVHLLVKATAIPRSYPELEMRAESSQYQG